MVDFARTAPAGRAVVGVPCASAGYRRCVTSTVTRAAVLRALPGLGDLLCAVPALRAMRTAFPTAHVTLVGLHSARWFVERFSAYVDDLLPVTSFAGLPETRGTAEEETSFLARARGQHFDVAFGLHGSGPHSNVLLDLLGAARRAGSYLPGHRPPEGGHFIPYREDLHEIHRVLAPVEHFGIPPRGDHLEWRGRRPDHHSAARARPYVVVHPGASRPDRRWSPAGFAAIGRGLLQRGLDVVLTGGPAETDTTAQLAAAILDQRSRPIRLPTVTDLGGRTPLDDLARLIRGARLTITNDTGISHLAAALAAPSVVVFTTSDLERWAPLDRALHRPVDLRKEHEGVQEPGETLDRRTNALEQQVGKVMSAVEDALR